MYTCNIRGLLSGGSSTRLKAICQGGPLGPSAAARCQQLPAHCNPTGAEEECDGLRRCEGRFRVAPLWGSVVMRAAANA